MCYNNNILKYRNLIINDADAAENNNTIEVVNGIPIACPNKALFTPNPFRNNIHIMWMKNIPGVNGPIAENRLGALMLNPI